MNSSDSSRRGRSQALLEELSPERRQLLERLLEKEKKRSRGGIPRIPRGAGGLLASDAQRRLWFLWRLEPDDTSYNECLAARLDGPLDRSRLERAVLALLVRHEVLRSVFEEVDGELVQQPREVAALELDPIDATESEAQVACERLRETPFDLAQGPLYRVRLFCVGPDSHVLAIALHHVVADGWSQNVFLRELTALYEAIELPPLPIQYADYAAWQKQELSSERLESGLRFWKEELSRSAATDLPHDFPRGGRARGEARTLCFPLDEGTASSIRRLGQTLGATPFVLVTAAVAGVLAHLTGQSDRTFGTPFAGRTRPELEGLIGFFLNLLPIRVRIEGDPTFADLVTRVRDVTLRAIQHQDVPFERVIDAVRPERDLTRTPLFQILINSPELEASELAVGDLRVRLLPNERDHAKYDLTLYLEPEGASSLRLRAVYRADLFRDETIRELGNVIVACLTRGSLEPERTLSDLILPRDVAGVLDRQLGGRSPLPNRRRDAGTRERTERGLTRVPGLETLVAGWSLLTARRAGTTNVIVGVSFDAKPPVPLGLDLDPELDVASLTASVARELAILERLPPIPTWAIRSRTEGNVLPFESVVCAAGDDEEFSFPLRLCLVSRGAPRLVLHHDAALLDSPSARALLDQLAGILESWERDSELRVREVDLARFAPPGLLPDPSLVLPRTEHEGVLPRIARVAQITPQKSAIRQHGQDFSYAEIWLASLAISERLAKCGARSQMAIAVRGPQSFHLFSAWLAVFQRNAVLVTIDPSLPARRVEHMLNAAGVELVIDVAPNGRVEVQTREAPAGSRITHADAAYVFFTSGTTGLPKGVLGTHQGLSHFLDWQRREFGIGPADRGAQLTGLSFDVVLRSVFLPLTSGATLCLPDDATDLGAESVLAFLAKERISFLHAVPTLTSSWLAASSSEISALERLFFAGEPLPEALVRAARRTFPRAEIVNLYGPTETTLAKCFARIGEPRSGAQPVGRPLPSTQALVLVDGNTRLGGIGEIGEVAIRTPFRTLGYVNAPDETRARFVPNPFRQDDDDLVYLTGDRGYYLPDGSLALGGRSDDQVKIWGVRVEPGEVARALIDHPKVDDAFVAARPAETGGARLVAWVSTRTPLDTRALRDFLEPRLPSVMIPESFVVLDKLPVNASGKVDRAKLPEPVRAEATFEAPKTPREIALAEVFSRVLGVPKVGLHDDFFVLGGHSLLATRALTHIRASLGVDLPLRALFEAPTVCELATRVDRAAALAALPNIEAHAGPAPLSFAQERLWFIQQLWPTNTAYNIPVAIRIRGKLAAGALSRALADLCERHRVLTTTFHAVDGKPLQLPGAAPVPELPRVDLTALDADSRWQRVLAAAEAEAQMPFDLERGPLLRGSLFALETDHHVLLITKHHIVSDAWSTGIMIKELVALYEAASSGVRAELAPLPIQYADYAAWQRRHQAAESLAADLEYWKEKLDGIPPLELPTDRPRPPAQTYSGERLPFSLPKELRDRLHAFARAEGVTLYMLLLAGLSLVLARHSRKNDFGIGTPVANRLRPETEPLIGFFVNTLVMRMHVSDSLSVRALVQQAKETTLSALGHQFAPFEQVVDAVKAVRDPSHNPLFQVMLILQNAPESELSVPGLDFEVLDLPRHGSKFDLTLSIDESTNGLAGYADFNTDLFDRATLVRLLSHFERALDAMVRAPESRASEIQLLDATERGQALAPASPAPDTRHRSVLALFQERVRRAPDSVAVATRTASLTYSELADRARSIAAGLSARGIGSEQLVAVLVGRSPDMVASLFGVMEAGAAWVPLDPRHPDDRIARIIQASGARVVVTEAELVDRLPTHVTKLLADRPAARFASLPVNDPVPDQLAYLMYTSGSTGDAKGVMITHRGLGEYVLDLAQRFEIDGNDTYLHSASLAFSSSVRQLLVPLCHGAKLVIADHTDIADGARFVELVRQANVTVLDLVPSYLRSLLDAGLTLPESVRLVLTASEPHRWEWVRRTQELAPRARQINMFGQTETTGIVSSFAIDPKHPTLDPSVPIGKPRGGTRMYVLDRRMLPTPTDVSGELYVGGSMLARGYAQMADATASSFVPDPFGLDPGARLFRTGDLVKRRRDGSLVHVGRSDHQLKIRGHRVEIGEVESVLASSELVRSVAVVPRLHPSGDPNLVAYVVATGPNALEALRARAEARLPAYMLPAAFVLLDEMPLLSSGKLDRARLPEPKWQSVATDDMPPRNPVEEVVATIFAAVLGLDRVPLFADFFVDLGGHSLLAAQVIARVRKAFGVSIDLGALFESPTVAGIATIVEPLLQSERSSLPKLVRRPPDVPTPASFAQERFWFLDRFSPGSHAYNVPAAVRIRGSIDETALERALQSLVARHEVLRTSLRDTDGGLIQEIAASSTLPLSIVSLEALDPESAEQRLAREMRAEAARPFQLDAGPLVRARLWRMGSQERVLALTLHHAITDGWSLGALIRELSTLYDAAIARAPMPAALDVQYGDFAIWQKQLLEGEARDREIDFWKTELLGLEPLNLPLDRPRPAVFGTSGGRVPFAISLELGRALAAFSKREGVTPFMTLLAAFQLLLARYSGQSNLAVGSPVAGRALPELEPLIGCFVNTLVFRCDCSDDPTVGELLARVRKTSLGAFAHQFLPFEKLVDALGVERDPGRPPLVQAAFVLQNTPRPALTKDGLVLEPVAIDPGSTRFELLMLLSPNGEGYQGFVEYASELFDAETVERWCAHYVGLLESLLQNPKQRVSRLDLGEQARKERELVLSTWNETRRDLGESTTLQSLVEQQAERTPEAIAVRDERSALSYRELVQRARRLGHRLQKLGVGADRLVGVALERSVELVVAVLGVLEAGGAWVPLDPSYPADRLAFMIADAGTPVVITTAALAGTLGESDTVRVLVEETNEREPDHAPHSFAGPETLAYAIYTSGSTGKPKAALNTHRAACNTLLWTQAEYPLDGTDRVLGKTPFGFDVSVWEMFWPLIAGAELVLTRQGGEKDPEYLAEFIRRENISIAHFVPSMLELFLEHSFAPGALDSLRRVVCSGETTTPAIAERFHARMPQWVRLENLYGPTETAVHITYWSCPRSGSRIVPIGRPMANCRCYVLDDALEPVPIGVVGELFLGGNHLARGYLGRPELTAERFLPDPFGSGERLYRSGDLARHRADGTLEFLGRIDHQIKLRGQRIELGEIESALLAQAEIKSAVVIVRELEPGDARLIAYVVSERFDEDFVKKELARRLPQYMLPSAFVRLDEFPLGPTGKLDRKRLPAPVVASTSDKQKPRSELEAEVARVFGELLGVNDLGVDDDFFQLGGHSLLAVRAANRLSQALGVELSLRKIFEHPTVARAASYVELLRQEQRTEEPRIVPRDRSAELPLSFSEERLWFIDRLSPGSSAYNMHASFRVKGQLAKPALDAALRAVVERHESLRTSFPDRGGVPIRHIHREAHWDGVSFEDTDEDALCERLRREVRKPFDLANGPLLRLVVAELGTLDHVVCLVVHHAIADGWSLTRLVSDLVDAYAGTARLPELPVQYADFAAWQREHLDVEAELEHFQATLAEVEPLELPLDHARPLVLGDRGNRVALKLEKTLSDRARAFAAERGVTPFMLLFALVGVFCGRLSGQKRFAIGFPIAGRSDEELDGVVGFFANTLVAGIDLHGSPSFLDVLERIQHELLGAYAHQHAPFEKLVSRLEPDRNTSRSPLFQVAFAMAEPTGIPTIPDLEVEAFELDPGISRFDLSFVLQDLSSGFAGHLELNADLFERDTAVVWAERFRHLLEEVLARPSTHVFDLDLSLPGERERLLGEWSGAALPPTTQTLLDRILGHAKDRADALALVGENTRLTRHDLERASGRLAGRLVELGVGPETRVALGIERSVDFVIAALAVWRAGGAYVPVDPKLPRSRQLHMLKDSRALLWITSDRALEQATLGVPVIHVEEGAEAALLDPSPRHAAYVIYTSGSSGRPKGVVIEHAGVACTIAAMIDSWNIDASTRVLAIASPSFDASVLEIFTALAAGATLFLPSREDAEPGEPLARYVRENRIDFSLIVPSVLGVMPHDLALQTLVVGGEASTRALIEPFARRMRVVNAYGPTEVSIAATQGDLAPGAEISIGRPLAGARVYVLDARMQPVPTGVYGELYVGGQGVGRGYVEHPALSAELFVPDPFSKTPGARLYRTGDRCRFRRDGRLDFAGRLDSQVKLRGFRIELGEIESRLLEHPDVRRARVVLREDVPGVRQLVAYVVTTSEPAGLVEWVSEQLPPHMVPSAFVRLETLPTTTSGKLDPKRLPRPKTPSSDPSGAPLDENERKLCQIVQGLLGLTQVSRDDRFFALGGDSISSVQLVARARREGLSLHVRDVFDAPNLAALALRAKTATPAPDADGPEPLSAPLTPIQRWFFAQGLSNPAHFNQSLWLEVDPRLDDARLEAALEQLVAHHAALRMRFSGGTQALIPLDELPAWFTRENGADLERIANEAQTGLDLEKGPLFRATLVTEPNGRRLLFLVAHHLVIDGVSWRILADDLLAISRALLEGSTPQLDTASISFLRWANQSVLLEQGSELSDELAYWREVLAIEGARLPRDRSNGRNNHASAANVSVLLSPECSNELLRGGLLAHRIEPGELLLAALANVVARWTGSENVRLDVERHGRDAPDLVMDTTRTVGWFTALFPFALRLPAEEAGLEELLHAVKREWRRVPHSGTRFGALRYGAREEELALRPRAEIVFNYLGQVAAEDAAGASLLSLAREATGKNADPDSTRAYLIEASAIFVGGRLRVSLAYSQAVHQRRTIEALANDLERTIERLTLACASPNAGRLHAEDFPAYRGSQRALDAFGETLRARADAERRPARGAFLDIEDLYALTPLQSGMLFDTLRAGDSGMYVEQTALELRGDLDERALGRAFQDLVDRHAILRTSFEWDGFDEPVQIVWRKAEIELQLRTDADDYVRRDRVTPFDLSRAPLARVALFQREPREWLLVVTHHHILLDGWSTGRVIGELMRFYEARASDRALSLPTPLRFRDYVAWIQSRDSSRDEAYWREVLAGVEEPTRLASERSATPGEVGVARRSLELSEELSAALVQRARAQAVTESALVHAAWALVLGAHSGSEDVLFGTVVSGRPAELAGVESAVGLFLNTVPVRVRLEPSLTTSDLARRVQAHMRDVQEHAHVPLSRLRSFSALPRNAVPFETALAFENYPAAATFSAHGLTTVGVHREEEASVPFALMVSPGERTNIAAQFQQDRFDAGWVEGLLRRFAHCLDWMTRHPDARIGELSLVDAAERERVFAFSIGAARSTRTTLSDMVEDTARRYPDLPAVLSAQGSLSYAELQARVTALAQRLVALGVKRETRVALRLERSERYVIAALAVLRAGASFVPIDPGHPEERQRFVLEDSGATLSVDDELLDRTPDDASVLLPPGPSPANAAYVIYTSGSTGRPKGVVIEHRGVSNTVLALRESWKLGPGTRSAFIASPGFDASIIEMFVPLTSGATLCIPSVRERQPGPDLADYLQRNAIDLAVIIPSMLSAMPKELALRTLVVGGEASTPALLGPYFSQQRILNVYGPTEISVVSSAGPILADEEVTIGTPLPGSESWILDREMRLVPVGVFGELYIGGVGLAREYLGRPDLTAERFVPHPYATEPGARLYRTGDRCRYRSDGRLEFQGRLDTQVKLRGFRIELQEIEAALESEASVRRAVVVVREDVPGVERLVGYVDLVQRNVDTNTLLAKLALRLPAYMVPSVLVSVESFPLSSSGKVDKRKLPKPEFESRGRERPPRSATEQTVAALFEELLGARDVGLDDDFFALGGHSLLATRLVGRIRSACGVDLPLKALFDGPSVAAVAENVSRLQTKGASDSIERLGQRESISLSHAQERIWFLQQLAPTSYAYNVPAVVCLRGPLDQPALDRAFARLVARHEILRSTYSDASGIPRARVHAPTIELRTSTADTEADWKLAVERETSRPFDLTRDLPLRILLIRVSETEHVLCLTLHHIACDGWSAGVLVSELAQLYAGIEFPELPIQYADYAAWQRADSAKLDRELAYWVERLGTNPEPLRLPLDRPRPPRQSYAGASVRRKLDATLARNIDDLAKRANATRFSLLLAGLTAVLARASGNRRIIVGTPVANRSRPETEHLLGVFLNTLAIATDVGDDPTFSELITRTRDAVVGALAHQDVPFERVLEAVRPVRDLSRTPLFQVMLNLIPEALPTRSLGELSIEPIPVEEVAAKFDLTFYVAAVEDGLALQVVYARDLFDEESVAKLLAALESALSQVSGRPDLRLSELQLVLPTGGEEAAGIEHFREMYRDFSGATHIPPRRGELRSTELAVACEGASSTAEAAWALLMARLAAANAAAVGVAGAERLLSLRIELEDDLSVRSFLARWEELVERATRFASLRFEPGNLRLFDSVVCVDDASLPADVDVALVGCIANRELRLSYDPVRFSDEQARALLEQWAFLVRQMTRSPQLSTSELSLVTDTARSRLPDPRSHIERVVYPSVTTRVAQRARENPATIAVRQGNRAFTYGDLEGVLHGVCARLAEDGVRPGDMVGISGPECFGRVAALVGTLAYGAIVLPLDESLPPLRRERMLEQARANYVLSLSDNDALELRSASRVETTPVAPDAPAYVFFTSGTTGTPKGVLGRHNGLAHFLDWQSREFGVGSNDRVGQLTNFSFDVVLRSILLPLVSGATLCLPEAPNLHVLEWLEREKVSLLHLVPTLAEAWLAEAGAPPSLPDMRVLFFAGEPLTDSLVVRYRKLCPNAEIVNLYGPTETTLAKCFSRVPPHMPSGAQAVGRPLPGTQALVLAGGRLCGIGEPGDVVIRTPHRSLGYFDAPEETKRKFVPNPFGSEPDDLVYLTGDRGYYLPDGALQLLGRSDDQLKLWGVRIEPHEIASALLEHAAVQSAFVTAEDAQGSARLVAYVVTRAPVDSSALIAHASQRLPSAVVPSAFVFLDALPVGPNGKIDRSRLPAPDLAREYAAPRTQAEETIVAVWQELLPVERVGIRDSFFALGGHSLLAARAVARIRELLGIELPVRALFEHPTVETLARHIGERRLSQLDESELGALLDAIEGEA